MLEFLDSNVPIAQEPFFESEILKIKDGHEEAPPKGQKERVDAITSGQG